MFTKMKNTFHEFPKTFWILTLSSFIDSIGGFMVMPFISIYMIQEFEISMIQVGLLFTIVSLGNLVGGFFGGAFTDKFGRKAMALYGLFISGLFSLVIIFIHNLTTLYIVLGCMGFFGSLGGPARGAMIADILPPQKRAEGYGILRVVVNLSATIGPAIGGFLALKNFSYLFIGDAISSSIVAIIFIVMIPETKPEKLTEEGAPKEKEATMAETMGGYKEVFKDWKFLFFVGVSMIMSVVYMQFNSTLPVYINETLKYPTTVYGWLVSMNAFMVVVLQFYITRKISKFPALIMIGVGNLLYGIGFGMLGFVNLIPSLVIAVIIITIGEMIIAPFSQAVAANMAPEDKRGRYMAIYNWSGLFPAMFGVLGAGAIFEKLSPNWLWYFTGILSMFAVFGYFLLHKLAADRFKNPEPVEEKVFESPLSELEPISETGTSDIEIKT